LLGEHATEVTDDPIALALNNVDYQVSFELNGQTVITSSPEWYVLNADQARARSSRKQTPRVCIAAQGVRAQLAHLLIERDVFYTSDVRLDHERRGYGTQGNPIRLGNDQYFMMGDNSPASLDGRFSFAQQGQNPPSQPAGPHLKDAWQRGEYQIGTVPADQLIGPAFFVYWPATDALFPDRYLPGPLRKVNHLPNPGRIRWIR